MDIVSQLIEENIHKAQAINQILEKNEDQLHRIEKDNEEIKEKNKWSQKIINSFSNFFSFNYYYNSNKKDILKENNIREIDAIDKIGELKELTQNINSMLDTQNEMLSAITLQTDTNIENIQSNQKKIKQLL